MRPRILTAKPAQVVLSLSGVLLFGFRATVIWCQKKAHMASLVE